MVVTDQTEARRNEEMLRTLTHHVVQAQEAERGRVALELHDTITQLLCAILIRCQALADQLPASAGPVKEEAIKLREMLGETAQEVERISRNLRPGVLEQLGLVEVLQATSTEFEKRTGVSLNLECAQLSGRLPAEIELTLYRILQEAPKKCGEARPRPPCDGAPDEAGQHRAVDDQGRWRWLRPGFWSSPTKGKDGLGLLSMRERAAYVGGAFKVKSTGRTGTEIEICIPLPPPTTTINGTSL